MSDEENLQQTKDFFALVKTIKPFTNDFLKRQKQRVNEMCYQMINDPQYLKKESYLRDVERIVEVLEDYDEITGVKYETPTSDLLLMATEKYNQELNTQFNNNKAQKIGMVAIESVYSLGILPAAKIIKYMQQA